jgi:hypothetical protein
MVVTVDMSAMSTVPVVTMVPGLSPPGRQCQHRQHGK